MGLSSAIHPQGAVGYNRRLAAHTCGSRLTSTRCFRINSAGTRPRNHRAPVEGLHRIFEYRFGQGDPRRSSSFLRSREPLSAGSWRIKVKAQHSLLSIAAAMIAAVLGADARGAEEASTMLSPQAVPEIAQVETEIDRIEAQTIERLAAPPDNQVQQIELLGKLMLYDKQLSVNRNEACAFCHMPEAGFTGPVSELNRTTGSYPGSVRTRFSNRKPQSHAYAPLSPVLHYNPGQGDLVGGNFWDMRATGRRLGNPAAEQAQGPPTNPVEMGLPDIARAMYRASQLGAKVQSAGFAACKRSDAGPYQRARSRPRCGPLRPDGAIYRQLRGLGGGDDSYFQVRCGAGGQGATHSPGAVRLRRWP